MGRYANDPQANARIKRSHDDWATNGDEWLRGVAHEEDDEDDEDEEDEDDNN